MKAPVTPLRQAFDPEEARSPAPAASPTPPETQYSLRQIAAGLAEQMLAAQSVTRPLEVQQRQLSEEQSTSMGKLKCARVAAQRSLRSAHAFLAKQKNTLAALSAKKNKAEGVAQPGAPPGVAESGAAELGPPAESAVQPGAPPGVVELGAAELGHQPGALCSPAHSPFHLRQRRRSAAPHPLVLLARTPIGLWQASVRLS